MNDQTASIVLPAIALTIATAIALYSWRRSRMVAIVAVVWAIISLFTARIPFFQNLDRWTDGDIVGFIAFGTVLTIPIVLFFVALWRSSAFQHFMNETPTWVLTATQVYRLTGASFLLLYLRDLLPAEIGLVNGVLDIIVGLTALPVAWMLFRGIASSRNIAIAWNLLGVLDLASAFTVVTLSIFGLLELDPAPTRMGLYPLSLVSVYQVAIALCIHIYLLRRLLFADTGASRKSIA
ncbi:MAG: hypothetical protein RLP44_25195 [Aggregatilineales bacterium]